MDEIRTAEDFVEGLWAGKVLERVEVDHSEPGLEVNEHFVLLQDVDAVLLIALKLSLFEALALAFTFRSYLVDEGAVELKTDLEGVFFSHAVAIGERDNVKGHVELLVHVEVLVFVSHLQQVECKSLTGATPNFDHRFAVHVLVEALRDLLPGHFDLSNGTLDGQMEEELQERSDEVEFE